MMLTWTTAITHVFFVLFEFHETAHEIRCNPGTPL